MRPCDQFLQMAYSSAIYPATPFKYAVETRDWLIDEREWSRERTKQTVADINNFFLFRVAWSLRRKFRRLENTSYWFNISPLNRIPSSWIYTWPHVREALLDSVCRLASTHSAVVLLVWHSRALYKLLISREMLNMNSQLLQASAEILLW